MTQERVEFPLAGRIISVNISLGSEVEEGDTLCILESMKMENPILAPVDGTITEIKVTAGQVVEASNSLAIIEY